MTETKAPWRPLASFAITLAGVLLAVTGAVMYVMPHGRVAYWNAFTIWGLGKDQWTTIHLLGGLLFLVSFPIHLVLNWRPLVGYVKKCSRLLGGVAAAVLLLFVLSAADLPPSRWLLGVSETIKESWPAQEPPAPHMEFRTVQSIVARQGLDPDDVLERLHRAGVPEPGLDVPLQELARQAGVPPAELYRAIGGDPAVHGRGLGRHGRSGGPGPSDRPNRRSRF